MMPKIFKKKVDEDDEKINNKLELEIKIMTDLAKYQDDYEVLYVALRKYLSNNLNVFYSDCGYIGIAQDDYEDSFYWGDILIYSTDDDINIGNILNTRHYASDGFYNLYVEVKSFTKNGGIRVKFSNDDELLEIQSSMILGRVIKVISMEDDGWEELFKTFIENRDNLKSMMGSIEKQINLYKSNIDDASETPILQTISELEKRLVKLETLTKSI
ncbi:MAG: hypothetical protein Q7J10_02675 [Methanosarcinaceae archaeon]|nr:hypothetical protein [Methanosarcinaceae archaeon]